MIERILNVGALVAFFGWLFLFAAVIWMLVGCSPRKFGDLEEVTQRDIRMHTEIGATESCPAVSMTCTGVSDLVIETPHPGDVSVGEDIDAIIGPAQ